MQQLFPYHNAQEPAALRLTRVIRTKDPFLFSVYNGALKRYEVWRRNPNGSLSMLFRIEGPRGEFVHPDRFARRALRTLQEMDRDPRESHRELEEHNRTVREREWRSVVDEAVEIGQYFRQAVAAEQIGATRWSPEDVALGLSQRWV